jgi:uracil-DNA glycosylase
MFHPRYVLVHPESKKETWKDLKEVRSKFTWFKLYFFTSM